MHAAWRAQLGVTVWLRPEERRRSASIADSANVEALVRDYWAEAMRALPG